MIQIVGFRKTLRRRKALYSAFSSALDCGFSAVLPVLSSGRPTDEGVSRTRPRRGRAQQGDRRREQEAPAPVLREHRRSVEPCAPVQADDIAAEDDGQSGADRVRGVPDRHLGRQPFGDDPVGHQPRAGRDAHALEPAVENPEDAQRQHRGAESEEQVADAAENESRDQKVACVAAVAPDAVDELRESVDQSVEREEEAEVGFRDAHLLVEIRHGDTQVLAHEIEERVTEDAHRHGAEFPVFETFDLLVGHAAYAGLSCFADIYSWLVRVLLLGRWWFVLPRMAASCRAWIASRDPRQAR